MPGRWQSLIYGSPRCCCPRTYSRFLRACRAFSRGNTRAPAATGGTSCRNYGFPPEFRCTACHYLTPDGQARRRRRRADRQSPWGCRFRGSAAARAYFSCRRGDCTMPWAFRFRRDKFCTGFLETCSCPPFFEFARKFLRDIPEIRKPSCPYSTNCWDRRDKTPAVPPGLTLARPLCVCYHIPALCNGAPTPAHLLTSARPQKPIRQSPCAALPPSAALFGKGCDCLLTLLHWFEWLNSTTPVAICQEKISHRVSCGFF